MNKEEPLRDQAERLRKKITKIEEGSSDKDISGSLPPRSKVHQEKKKKTKWKVKYPVIRLLALFFILLPIVSFSLYTINENKHDNKTEPAAGETKGNVETVDLEGAKKDNVSEIEGQVDENQEHNDTSLEQMETIKESSQTASGGPNDKAAVNDKAANKSTVKTRTIYHKVQADENLFRIAMKYYNSQSGIEKIKQENGIQGNEIQAGQTLKITLQD
jgi:LysM repeat protein